MDYAVYRWGVEIEGYGLSRPKVRELVEAATNDACAVRDDYGTSSALDWSVAFDRSIAQDDAFEVRTPAMYGEHEPWAKLRAVCRALREAGAQVGITCGLHVHHDAVYILKAARLLHPSKSSPEWLAQVALALYARLENVIDTLMPPSRRASNSIYCTSVRAPVASQYPSRVLGQMRLDAMPIVHVGGGHHLKLSTDTLARHGTLEYRQHSGTLNASKIIAWVKLTGLIQHKIAGIICYNDMLPAEMRTLDEMLAYLDAPASLQSYYHKRQAALAHPDQLHNFRSCGCVACANFLHYVEQVLNWWAYAISYYSTGRPINDYVHWHPFDSATKQRLLSKWTYGIERGTDFVPQSADELRRYLEPLMGTVELTFSTVERKHIPRQPFLTVDSIDIESSVLAGDDDADYSSREQAPYLTATKAAPVAPTELTTQELWQQEVDHVRNRGLL